MKRKDSHKANPLVSIPVIVMLAMAPLSMDGKQFVPIDNAHLTEVSAQVNSVAPKAYAEPQAPQEKSPAPFGMKFFLSFPIQQIVDAKANGKDAKLVYTTIKTKPANNGVVEVYLIEPDYPKRHIGPKPPMITELIYHNTPNGEFCSVIVEESIKENSYGKDLKVSNKRLDDKSAQELINLLAGETEWKNATNIKFSETSSSELRPTEFY